MNKGMTLARRSLQRAGVRPTLNRLLVMQAVSESGVALTAREVFESVSREQALNKVTVYRILDTLSDTGAVNRSTCGDRIQHFCVGEGHSHFHCTRCGVVQCIDNQDLRFDASSVGRSLPMTVETINLQLEGVCRECKQSDGP